MNKKRTIAIAVTFFLVQAFFSAGIASAEIGIPNPLTEIKTGGSDLRFKETCNMLCVVLSLYRSDAFDRLPKAELIKKYGSIPADSSVRIDLENIDVGKKGWTRYYPFTVGERRFVARVFLTSEAKFQTDVAVLSEMIVEKFGVTLQILPGIDEILKDRSIRPNNIYSPSQADKSA